VPLDAPPEHRAANIALAPIPAAELGGYVWLSFASDPPPLRTYLGSLPDHLERLGLSHYTLARDLSVELPCNWKVLLDAFNEGYHVPTTHPELAGVLDPDAARIELYERHNRILQPMLGLEPGAPPRPLAPELAAMLRELGVDESVTAAPLTTASAIQAAIRRRIEEMGWDTSRLADDDLTDNYTINVFPNASFSGLFSHKHWLSRFRPHPSDPERCFYDFQEYVRLPRSTPAPQRPKHERFEYGERPLSLTIEQDVANCIRVQEGLRTSAMRDRGIVLGALERGVAHMHALLERHLE
jgi:phenylpropionate dioxygenase-like ring-hydroxylating dioxygenase large terminal subunit